MDIVISSPVGDHSEDRAKRVLQLSPVTSKKIAIECTDTRNLNFSFSVSSSRVEVGWPHLSKMIGQEIPVKKGGITTVLIDLTDKDWEYCFFVLPCLLARPDILVVCGFTAPDNYPQPIKEELPPIETYGIRQPPGWITGLDFPSIAKDNHPKRHVFFLGFDSDRAQKFVQHYNWIREDCISVVGDPPYILDGQLKCRLANESFLKELPVSEFNRRTISAASPSDTILLLQQLIKDSSAIDIILLGTSPMTLGATLFYQYLPEKEKSRVRFLHDFPKRHVGRTVGVGQTWLFDCF
ncbi:hypothetical protein [Noviherbaspirillum pedocola]|uniref:Uncharacterized protein n=1 Tax=Noviherbaspirillum pedocola TaxID=2801341 RepID=A0A934W4U7_9BURK|nr:hypothetical protein [Noviherbaspirillum pedocola]MBK4738926.1 hypothetical protein [Noviherbaspirillum pedocola]